MLKVRDIMTTQVEVIGPLDSLRRAAQRMEQLNVGSLPVCEGQRLLGMVTDRDITIRGTAAGLGPDAASVSDVMTEDPEWCTEDQDCAQVLRIMADAQLRRLPVIDARRALVGIVSLGDLATKRPRHIDAAMRKISTPSEPVGSARNS